MLARQTGFVLPVVNGEIHLANRVGGSFAGHFAAVGGSSESAPKNGTWSPAVVDGCARIGLWDYFCLTNNSRINLPEGEAPINTATREVTEEMYVNCRAKPLREVFHLGYTHSQDSKFWLHLYLAILTPPFSLDERALSDLTAIRYLSKEKVAPATTNALRALGIVLRKNRTTLPQTYQNLHLPNRWASAHSADFEVQEPLWLKLNWRTTQPDQ